MAERALIRAAGDDGALMVLPGPGPGKFGPNEETAALVPSTRRLARSLASQVRPFDPYNPPTRDEGDLFERR